MFSYPYDAENRMISVDGGATTYTYDALSRRVRPVPHPPSCTSARVPTFFARSMCEGWEGERFVRDRDV
jgi:hypothetical protein